MAPQANQCQVTLLGPVVTATLFLVSPVLCPSSEFCELLSEWLHLVIVLSLLSKNRDCHSRLGPREGKWFTQGHTAIPWQSQATPA